MGRPLKEANTPVSMKTLKFEYRNPEFEKIANELNS